MIIVCVLCFLVCPWMWDNLTCWQAASIGEVVVVNCPDLFHEFMGPDDGDWLCFSFLKTDIILFISTKVSADFFFYFQFSEMGKVSRNCTEDGWSEPSPHYVDVCFFYDNTTKPVRPLWPSLKFIFPKDTHTTDTLSVTLGHVLRLCQSPVHSWLQHIAGVSDYSHGHSLQVQVSVTICCAYLCC